MTIEDASFHAIVGAENYRQFNEVRHACREATEAVVPEDYENKVYSWTYADLVAMPRVTWVAR